MDIDMDLAVDPLVVPAPLHPGAPASGPVRDLYQGDGTPIVGSPGIVTPGAAARINHYPVTLARGAGSQAVNVGDNLLPDQFRPTAPGFVRIAGSVREAATFTVSFDGGVTAYALNGGTAITAGSWFEDQVTVTPGDQIVVSVSAPATAQGFRAVYVPDML